MPIVTMPDGTQVNMPDKLSPEQVQGLRRVQMRQTPRTGQVEPSRGRPGMEGAYNPLHTLAKVANETVAVPFRSGLAGLTATMTGKDAPLSRQQAADHQRSLVNNAIGPGNYNTQRVENKLERGVARVAGAVQSGINAMDEAVPLPAAIGETLAPVNATLNDIASVAPGVGTLTKTAGTITGRPLAKAAAQEAKLAARNKPAENLQEASFAGNYRISESDKAARSEPHSTSRQLMQAVGGPNELASSNGIHNVAQVTKNIQKDLGLEETGHFDPGTPTRPGTIDTLLESTIGPYQEAAKLGVVRLTTDERGALVKALNEKSFLELPPEAKSMLTKAAQSGEVDAAVLVDDIQRIRNRVKRAANSTNVDADAIMANDQLVQKVLEDALERTAMEVDESLFARLNAARTQRAKIHSIEDSLNGTQVDPTKLLRLKKKGVPLDGHAALAADLAEQYPTAFPSMAKLAEHGLTAPARHVAYGLGRTIAGGVAAGAVTGGALLPAAAGAAILGLAPAIARKLSSPEQSGRVLKKALEGYYRQSPGIPKKGPRPQGDLFGDDIALQNPPGTTPRGKTVVDELEEQSRARSRDSVDDFAEGKIGADNADPRGGLATEPRRRMPEDMQVDDKRGPVAMGTGNNMPAPGTARMQIAALRRSGERKPKRTPRSPEAPSSVPEGPQFRADNNPQLKEPHDQVGLELQGMPLTRDKKGNLRILSDKEAQLLLIEMLRNKRK